MSLFNVIVFVVLSLFLTFRVKEWASDKTPTNLASVVLNSLMLFGFVLNTILEHVSVIVIK